MTLRVAVVGASGRMGSLTVALVEQAADLELAAAIGSGDDLAQLDTADVVVDFTRPDVSPLVAARALEHGTAAVLGTSGWAADRVARLAADAAAHPDSGVLIVPNFALGSVLATSFARIAARYFDSIEIVEAHHEGKIDSPSGTAVRTAELMAKARADLGPVAAPHADQRARGQQVAAVPIHSIRMRGVVARQQVLFGGAGEQLVIEHDTLSSDAYTAGLLLAIRQAPALRGVTVGLDALLELGS